jgi:RNA polymerase sigma factor (sigma-70 family)
MATGAIPATTVDPTSRLVENARHGDRAAFEALLRRRLDDLFRISWAILGDERDARDATQDACLMAWRRLPTLRDPASFDAWLTRIAVNGCRMRLRSRARVREIQVPELEAAAPIADDPAATLADADAIARAFDRLDPDARAILVLHHLRDLPVASIATVLGVPVGTIKSRLHTARAALARAIEREQR